jgi:hypothetical protein
VSKLAILAIPVRPHVRQFMLFEYGLAQPHAMRQDSFIGRAVRMKLEKQPFRQLHRSDQVEGTSWHFTLPTALKHYTLTLDSARQLGEMFDKLFNQQLIMWVKAQVAATGNEREALRTFCKNYNIDPSHADLETLRKVYRDYKDKVLRENNQGQLQGQLLYLPGGVKELFRDYAIAS